ncbi:MAG: DUF4255 domain-containing protein [Epulopiscium sp.]|jgi:hypothetical protein|nr:DUF4255 domain-containing protein [Candidatus Epulonipiscium sp.]
MGSYTVIADTSKTLVELLRSNLIPEPVKKPEDIGLCTPDERGGSILGLYLYDIEENQEVKNLEKVMLDKEHFKNPPTSINLYYMLFVRSESEVAARAIDEQRIMGRAIQVLNDNTRVSFEDLWGTLKTENEVLDIQNLVLPFEEKAKIFNLFTQKAMLASFYKVGPVFIDSQKVRRIRRVVSADISIQQKR